MSVNLLLTRPTTFCLQGLKNISKCSYATNKANDILTELEVEVTPTYEVEQEIDQEELNKKRNKSRLSENHYRILHGQKPYDQSYEWYHDTLWYRKRMLGRYGIEAAGVSPAICWPTKEEIENRKEYERVAYPESMQEIWKQIEEKKKEDALEIKNREEYIDKTIANFDKWRATLQAKIQKKEEAILAAKEKKERMMQEIREEFGYDISPKDERFKELLEKKEKEDKKKKNLLKKQIRNEKLMAYLNKTDSNNSKTDLKSNENKNEKINEKKEE